MGDRARSSDLENRLGEIYLDETADSDQLRRQTERYRRCISAFRERYGAEDDSPLLIFRSPGRTELSGNHTDHNGGYVVAAAVHLDCVAVVRARSDTAVRLSSDGYSAAYEVRLDALEPVADEEGSVAALIRGVASAVMEWGGSCGGFDAHLNSAVPVGSGLSSSAAVEVLLAEVFNSLYNESRFDVITLARIGRRAENRHFGKPCGLMDQLACAAGGISGMDLAEPDSPRLYRLTTDFARHGVAVVIVATGGSHADLTEEYAAVPREMRAVADELGGGLLRDNSLEALLKELPRLRRRCGDRAVLRALHFFDETERARRQYSALAAGAIDDYLTLVHESGESSWKLLQNVAAAAEPREQGIPLALTLTDRYLHRRGIRRAARRVHGGGFAGTVQVYLPLDELEEYCREMEQVFGTGAAVVVRVSNGGVARVI